MNLTKITVLATIAADRAKTWRYYTEPEHITQWNFASPDWHCPRASNDMRTGGTYSARMEAKDGSFGFDFTVVYDEVTDHQSFAYTMEDGRKASVVFADADGGTLVTVTFDPEKLNPAEMQQQGWQAILNNFKKYTEEN
jgi:uncharacterized protein YndB with AHSA1/START domain